MNSNNNYKAVYKVNHSGGSGSCFYLKSLELFVTNHHVVEGFKTVAIQDNDKNAYIAKVVLVNSSLDIALLSADGDFSHIPEIHLPETTELEIGQKIYAAGYPFGLPFTVTEGTVSSPKQLLDNRYYIQTDAAVNPGNSGGPMFNDRNEVVAITVSKRTDADNMGFGIPINNLQILVNTINELNRDSYNVQCTSCEEIISDDEEYCPSCGKKLTDNIFKEHGLTDLAVFCEDAIKAMEINPILARVGYEAWKFHKGSSEIRIYMYEDAFLFCSSAMNILPKKNLEPLFTYLLSEDLTPYKLGVDENQVHIVYRVHVSDIFSEEAKTIQQNITKLAFKADELDDYLVNTFGCEFSEYSKNKP